MMTSRDFYNFVLSNVSDDSVKEFASHKLAQMDATNAKRVSKPSKRAIENEPIKKNLLGFIGEGCTASDIAESRNLGTESVRTASSDGGGWHPLSRRCQSAEERHGQILQGYRINRNRKGWRNPPHFFVRLI